jgi:two-component system response regulator
MTIDPAALPVDTSDRKEATTKVRCPRQAVTSGFPIHQGIFVARPQKAPTVSGGKGTLMRLSSSVLLVEDDEDHTLLMRRALDRARVANPLVVVHDGEAARDYLFGIGRHAGRDPRDAPVLVLLDLKLPKISGIDILRRIRAHPFTEHIPVVVLTTSDLDEDLVRAYGLGANSFVRKPVDFDAFQRAVERIALYWLVVNQPPPVIEREVA